MGFGDAASQEEKNDKSVDIAGLEDIDIVPDRAPAGSIGDAIDDAIEEEEVANRGGDFGEGEVFWRS